MAAMGNASSGDTITVRAGTYKESVVFNPGVSLVAVEVFEAVIKGRGRETVVTMAPQALIDGFEIRGGSVGVYAKSPGVTIARCRIVQNDNSAIMCVGNVAAIRDNVIAFNRGSGIQGWDLRSTVSSIAHNTIAYNRNHGIALGGLTSVIIENNIIAFNENYGIKTEGDSLRVHVNNNCLYNNGRHSSLYRANNMSVDPRFAAPRKMDFSLGENSPCRSTGSDNSDVGSRIFE
jgi:hypothetical protein